MVKFFTCKRRRDRLKNLEVVYFLESGDIIPFLREEEVGNSEYYEMRTIRKTDRLDDTTRKKVLAYVRLCRYIDFFHKGYSYFQLDSALNEAKDYLVNRCNYVGISEVYDEKNALDKAKSMYYLNENSKKLKRV